MNPETRRRKSANAADFAPGSKAALPFPALDSILEKLLGAGTGQLRTPVGKPTLLDALFADFEDIARTSRWTPLPSKTQASPPPPPASPPTTPRPPPPPTRIPC